MTGSPFLRDGYRAGRRRAVDPGRAPGEATISNAARADAVLGLAREFVIVGLAAAVYCGVRAVTEGSISQALANAEAIERLERSLGIAWENAAQSVIIGSSTLVALANWVYIWGHWPVIIVSAAFLYVYRPAHYRVLRNAVIASGLIGFVFFYALPTAPPRLIGLGLTDTVLEQSRAYRTLQPPSLTNQYAAMPSLHFGWNLLVGIVLFAAFTCLAVRAFAVVMPIAMGFSVVATANHFVLDVVVSLLVVARRAGVRPRARTAPYPRGRSARTHRESGQPGAPAAATLSRQVSSRAASGGARRQGFPFFVAHRAGNDLVRLRAAEELGLELVEADVRLFRGRLEVRHLKTLGPIPVLWDRWQLANPFAPRLRLGELLEASGPETELMLDLKGRSPRLAAGVLAALGPMIGSRDVTICARAWSLLEPFEGLPGVRTIHSVGSARQLEALLRLGRRHRLQGISIHERLLTPATFAELRSVTDLVMTWPANAVGRARELVALGVDGLITDRLDLAREVGSVGLDRRVGRVSGLSPNVVLESLETAAGRFVALDLRFVAAALAFQLANLALRSFALRNVLAAAYPEKRISPVTVGAAYAAGVALNAFAPARGGEALKIGLLRLRIPGSSVPTLVSAGVLLTVLDALIGSSLIVGAWGLGVLPALPSPQLLSLDVLTEHPFITGGVALVIAATVALVSGPLSRRARGLWLHVEQGGAILRTPTRYVRDVVTLQVGGWVCRMGVAFCLLAAFGLPATVPLAALVVVAGGLSTLVPTPGGAGTQQVLLVYALQRTATTAAALSFSVGMQVGITTVNALIGVVALMLMFRTVRPLAAVRAAHRSAAP